MATLRVNITLDNMDSNVDANQIADQVESIIRQLSGYDVRTNIYENDGSNSSNPIMAQNVLRRLN